MTGAWFTDAIEKPNQTLTFGTVNIEIEGDDLEFTSNGYDATLEHLMPGDNISMSATLTNAGDDAVVLARVWAEITPRTGYTGSPLTNPIDVSDMMSAWVNIDNTQFAQIDGSNDSTLVNLYNKLKGYTDGDQGYVSSVDNLPDTWTSDLYIIGMTAEGTETLAIDEDIDIELGNDYQGATITLHLCFYAFQMENLLASDSSVSSDGLVVAFQSAGSLQAFNAGVDALYQ